MSIFCPQKCSFDKLFSRGLQIHVSGLLVFIEFTCCCLLPLAGNIVLELSKDKHNASLLDRQLVQFQSSVNRVENELNGQIRYLTQVKHTIRYHRSHT